MKIYKFLLLHQNNYLLYIFFKIIAIYIKYLFKNMEIIIYAYIELT